MGTVYEHCVRALEYGLKLGPHGIPLMGTGDWNDGMNQVGARGQGESVWNGWFMLTTLKDFAALAQDRSDVERAAWCRERADALREALEQHAWDGGWYRRAYFDDGTPLGSAANDECQIDSIAQSWAVISGAADPTRARQAMAAVQQRLVRVDERLILLFDPPFETAANSSPATSRDTCRAFEKTAGSIRTPRPGWCWPRLSWGRASGLWSSSGC
jgi:cellobiose phosphorylase